MVTISINWLLSDYFVPAGSPKVPCELDSGGRKGTELEPNHSLLPVNEDFSLLTKDLLDAIEAMEKSDKNNYAL